MSPRNSLAYGVGPGVHRDFVASHVFLNENLGALNNTRADNEEGSIDLLLTQEAEEVLGVIRRTVIEAEQERLVQTWK
jgi:hypothetical protein